MAKTTKTAKTAKSDKSAAKAPAPAPKANAPLRDPADPPGQIFVGPRIKPEYLALALATRHGLVTGATGTGKTVTLQVLAEGFSRAGVPVFAADIKGDLSGIAEVGEPKDFLLKRAAEVGLENYKNSASPVVLWDVFGA